MKTFLQFLEARYSGSVRYQVSAPSREAAKSLVDALGDSDPAIEDWAMSPCSEIEEDELPCI